MEAPVTVPLTQRDPYQPALRWYNHLWRYALAIVVSIAAGGSMMAEQPDIPIAWPRWWIVDLVAAVIGFVLVFWRRRWPMTIAVTLTLISVVSPLMAGATILAVVSLATRRCWWQLLVIAVLFAGASLAQYQLFSHAPSSSYWLVLIPTLVSVAATLAWGMYIGSKRELVWTLRQRAENAEAEQATRAREARVTERSRIAREMHDVLAHRISQISLHAGALTFRADLTADEMRASAGVIQDKAHEALLDLRGVLGVLRDDTAAASGDTSVEGARPQPTYANLPDLIAEAQLAGTVEFVDQLSTSPPEATGRAVYRIVQEGITNAGKHAPGAKLSISVHGSPQAGLTLTLRNRLGFAQTTTPGAGLGLIGLTERAEQLGGRLSHTSEAGEFRLLAWLPWGG